MGNILIGCERSGITRDAFISAGHNAVSCDLEPTDKPGPHLQCDVFKAIQCGWDLIILHPPCTYMAVSGNRWYANTQRRRRAELFTGSMWLEALNHAKHVALENPVSSISNILGRATQTIQPWQFGHGETKRICWWLHNLPKLQPTRIVEGREPRIWKMPPSADRARLRSEWFTGIADAQARQWGDFINGN